MSAAEAVALVEIEQTVERRAEWRDGFDAGVKTGAIRYFQSPVMENIAVELALLRTLYAAVCDELERSQRLVEWYRGKLADAYHVIGNPRREVRA